MELYFNMFKIKYTLLNELVENISFTQGEEINIFINVETILKKITSTIEDRENVLSGAKRNLMLTSCVFNLVAHYRNFFNKKRVCSKIYLYAPESKETDYLNRNYIADYRTNSTLLNRDNLTSIGNTYEGSVKMIKMILSYVDGVYFITSGVMEPSIIPKIITTYVDNNVKKNFMITDDRYDYQYTKDRFYILKPRLEKSIMIYDENIMDVLKEKTKCKNIATPDVNFTSFIISILGDSYRHIDKIKGKGISSIYKDIQKGIDNNLINDEVSNITSMVQIFDESLHNQLALNYLTTSVDEQVKRISMVDVNYIKGQLVDKHDAGYLREINDEYFLEFPLNIIEINRGVSKRKSKISWR